MQVRIDKNSFGQKFPTNSMIEMSHTIGVEFDKTLEYFYQSKNESGQPQPYEHIFNYFDKIGIDISVYKQFENTWRYDISTRNNEILTTDMFIDTRKLCISQALISAFNVRENQISEPIPHLVTFDGLRFTLEYLGIDNLSFSIEDYLESCKTKKGYFICEKDINGFENKIRVIITEEYKQVEGNFQAPVQKFYKFSMFYYVEDYETFSLNPYFFKL
jgi:hypothetical protein